MIAANDAFQKAVVAARANEGSLLVNVESFTPNELKKLVTLVESGLFEWIGDCLYALYQYHKAYTHMTVFNHSIYKNAFRFFGESV